VVSDLAELISLCAQARGEPDCFSAAADGAAWAATAASLGARDERLDRARAALRDERDSEPLAALAADRAGAAELACVRAAHGARVDYDPGR